MNAVGIDVSKGKSMVCVLRPFGEVVVTPYTVGHAASELENLAYSLKSLDGETRVDMEHTGRYNEPAAQVLYEVGLYVSAVNPQLIKKYGNNTLRRVKTDKADAMKIARYALDNWVELREYIPMETARENLKLVCRQFNLYVKLRTQLKNNLIALLDKTFPGANTFFTSPTRSDGSQKWVDFASTFWHCECVCGVIEKAFTERYEKWCRRHGYNFSADKALDIYAESCGHIAILPKNESTKVLIKGAIAQLNAISQTVETFRLNPCQSTRLLRPCMASAILSLHNSWPRLVMSGALPIRVHSQPLLGLTPVPDNPVSMKPRVTAFPKVDALNCGEAFFKSPPC